MLCGYIIAENSKACPECGISLLLNDSDLSECVVCSTLVIDLDAVSKDLKKKDLLSRTKFNIENQLKGLENEVKCKVRIAATAEETTIAAIERLEVAQKEMKDSETTVVNGEDIFTTQGIQFTPPR